MELRAQADTVWHSNKVKQWSQNAGELWKSRERIDNLFRARQAYQEALQWAIARTQPLPVYPQVADALRQVTQEFKERVRVQKGNIKLALAEGIPEEIEKETNKMMNLVPDQKDPAYQDAY